jgi:hypothetical protein
LKLFFDEDLGKAVPEALRLVGVQTDYVGPARPIQKGTADEIWIPRCGREGWLVLSANREILRVQQQRQLWISHSVGGVFLTTGQIRAIDLLGLILRKLSWLDAMDRLTGRPFAFSLSARGQTARIL